MKMSIPRPEQIDLSRDQEDAIERNGGTYENRGTEGSQMPDAADPRVPESEQNT